jgi:hypothetical protein
MTAETLVREDTPILIGDKFLRARTMLSSDVEELVVAVSPCFYSAELLVRKLGARMECASEEEASRMRVLIDRNTNRLAGWFGVFPYGGGVSGVSGWESTVFLAPHLRGLRLCQRLLTRQRELADGAPVISCSDVRNPGRIGLVRTAEAKQTEVTTVWEPARDRTVLMAVFAGTRG